MKNFNFTNTDFIQNPYKYYKEFRDYNHPVWMSLEERKKINTQGIWLFSKYEDALEIFHNTTHFSKDINQARSKENSSTFDSHLLHRDGDDHARLRGIIEKFFSGKNLQKLETTIEKLSLDQLKNISSKKTIDLINDYAEIIPLYTIGTMLGIPNQDLPKIRAWTLQLITLFDFAQPKDIVEKNQDGFQQYFSYIQNFIENVKPGSLTLIGTMLQAEDENKMTHDEVVAMTALLLLTGQSTTIDLIGNGLWLLLTHKDQLKKIEDNPNLVSSAIEEILRYECPGQRAGFRIVTKPIKIGTKQLEIGDQIDIIIGSVNRDESIFKNADVFDVERKNNKHLAFGAGIHNCLGKNLARQNAKIAFKTILPLLGDLEVENEIPQWRSNTLSRGLEKLNVVRK